MPSAAVAGATLATKPASGAVITNGSKVHVLGFTGTSCASATETPTKKRMARANRRMQAPCSVDGRQAGEITRRPGRRVIVEAREGAYLVVRRRAGHQARWNAGATRRALGRRRADRARDRAGHLLAPEPDGLRLAVVVPAAVAQGLRCAHEEAVGKSLRPRVGVVGRAEERRAVVRVRVGEPRQRRARLV